MSDTMINNLKATLGRLITEKKQLKAENARLREIVEKLPKTMDGVPVFIGSEVWLPDEDHPLIVGHVSNSTPKGWWYANRPRRHGLDVGMCYSTREAALATKEGTNEKKR